MLVNFLKILQKMKLLILSLLLTNTCWISCIILTPDLLIFFEDPELENLVQEFGRICEGTRLCLVNVSELHVNSTDKGFPVPCCEACSCDEDCYVTNDCCPDIIEYVLDETEVVNINDNPRRCNQVEYPLNPMTELDIESYEMISMCPSDYSDDSVKEKCERRYDEQDPLQPNEVYNADIVEIIPVSDNTTLIPYKNINCAICSEINVNQVVPWDTEVVCSKHEPFLFHNGKAELRWLSARNDCRLSYTTPDPVKPGAKQCDYLIDRCNSTWLYHEKNPFLERACASYTSVYKHYKNVHCYLCSGNTEESFADECFLTPHGEIVGFTGILHFKEILPDLEKENNKDAICDLTVDLYANLTGTCIQLYCSDMMRLAGLQCEPYYSKAYQIGYTTRTRLFLRPDFTGFESFLQLMDKIETSLSTIDNIGGLGLCFYQYDIYLNISEEKLLERETLSQTSAIHIDLRVTYCQLFKRKSAVFSEIQNMMKVYEKFSNYSAYVSAEYIAENYESVSDLEWIDEKEKLLPPIYPLHMMVYEITKGDLAKVTIKSHIMMMPSQHPIPVNYLQMCAKVVLHVDSREITRHMDENNAPVVKVLGEKVDSTEVIVSADGDKIMICAEKYIELAEKQENRVLNEDEKPTSRAMKIQQFKHFTFIPVFLVMKDHFGR